MFVNKTAIAKLVEAWIPNRKFLVSNPRLSINFQPMAPSAAIRNLFVVGTLCLLQCVVL